MAPHVDVLALNCPLHAETERMVNARTVRLLRRGSYIVNCSRGAEAPERVAPRRQRARERRLAGRHCRRLRRRGSRSQPPPWPAAHRPAATQASCATRLRSPTRSRTGTSRATAATPGSRSHPTATIRGGPCRTMRWSQRTAATRSPRRRGARAHPARQCAAGAGAAPHWRIKRVVLPCSALPVLIRPRVMLRARLQICGWCAGDPRGPPRRQVDP
jgi:hypothetical protein